MDGYQIFLLLLAAYIALLISIGWYFNRRQVSIREFLLAGRRAGALSIGFSAAASWLTAGALLAVIGFFILLGMGSVWGFVAPNILALLIIALFVGKIRSIPAMTQPELLEIRYGSFLRTPIAIIIIVVMILFAVADIKGFAMVLQIFYGIDNIQAALIVSLSVAVYVTLGGLSAVIATDVIQYICLACFVFVMAVLLFSGVGEGAGLDFELLVSMQDVSWWNPFSIGLPMVLIFCLAIIPGWVSEQDPWQKIWAARDGRSARVGMVLGALLVALIFCGCAIIALGLRSLYPEIAKMGFPMGMAKAEPALLMFIMDSGLSHVMIGLCAVALATAAMSCADTFAASGASCLARDIYQRRYNPAASMKQMLIVNRLSVLLIIGCATIGSFFITSIIDAIHIATFIASASYFFVLMGGLYWKRGTAAGAAASMISGFSCQSTLVFLDVVNTQPGGPPFLESIHPLLMGHGVIVAMSVSGFAYFVVSLATASSDVFRLAPFFKEEATLLSVKNSYSNLASPLSNAQNIYQQKNGASVYLKASLDLPINLAWHEFIKQLAATHPHWISFSGFDSIRRCTRPDILSCVSLVRGEESTSIWLEAEGTIDTADELRDEVSAAYDEALKVLQAGLKSLPALNAGIANMKPGFVAR